MTEQDIKNYAEFYDHDDDDDDEGDVPDDVDETNYNPYMGCDEW